MSFRFAVVYEHENDFNTATELADRVLCEKCEWARENITDYRQWIDKNRESLRLTWTGIKRSSKSTGVRARGFFEDGPGQADAIAARRALEYLLLEFDDTLDAVIFIRDQDDQPNRKLGLTQARNEHERSNQKPKVVIGFSIPEREAWVISGFEPIDENEKSRLTSQHELLGFDPCVNSHRLTAGKDNTATRSPKRVLRALTNGDFDRERRCWNETDLSVLRQRGAENGLANYLAEVQNHLATLIGYDPRRSKT